MVMEGYRGAPGEGPGVTLFFKTKLRPKGPKKFLETGPPNLSVCIHHCSQRQWIYLAENM